VLKTVTCIKDNFGGAKGGHFGIWSGGHLIFLQKKTFRAEKGRKADNIFRNILVIVVS